MADQMPEFSSLSEERKGEPRLYAHVAHVTDVGRRRHNNQDNYLILPLGGDNLPPNPGQGPIKLEEGGLLVAVADGMGGHFRGEEASRLCVEKLSKEIMTQLQILENGDPDLPAALQKTVEVTHQAVYAHAQGYDEKLTMGTTLTAVVLRGAHAVIAQVGDSRAYLLRDGNLILLTQDQTIGNQLRSRGEDFTKVDAHIQEMLVQAVGAQAGIDVIMVAVDLEPQDLLLVCSDGLYKVVTPADIVGTLELEMGLSEKATHLVTLANEGGGPDNITVILTEICQDECTVR